VLLIGEAVTTRALVTTVGSGATSEFPSVNPGGTLVLLNVNRMDAADQQRLNTWLEDWRSKPRVISTSQVSLVPMMRAGLFLESLYYRLNTLCLTAESAETLPMRRH
jgi:DNA-binding NtrC family response regulator